jgi:hypothetical protein
MKCNPSTVFILDAGFSSSLRPLARGTELLGCWPGGVFIQRAVLGPPPNFTQSGVPMLILSNIALLVSLIIYKVSYCMCFNIS